MGLGTRFFPGAVVGYDDPHTGENLNYTGQPGEAHEAGEAQQGNDQTGQGRRQPAPAGTPVDLLVHNVPEIESVGPEGGGQGQQGEDIADDTDPAPQMGRQIYQGTVLGDVRSCPQQGHEGDDQDQQQVQPGTGGDGPTDAADIPLEPLDHLRGGHDGGEGEGHHAVQCQ